MWMVGMPFCEPFATQPSVPPHVSDSIVAFGHKVAETRSQTLLI